MRSCASTTPLARSTPGRSAEILERLIGSTAIVASRDGAVSARSTLPSATSTPERPDEARPSSRRPGTVSVFAASVIGAVCARSFTV